MLFDTIQSNEALIVKILAPRLDAKIAVDFKNQMTELIQAGHYDIIFDFKNVDFIDSSGLGSIVTCLKTVGRRGDIVVCSLGEPVEQMFQLTRMNKVFRIYSDIDKAKENFNIK